MISNSLAEFDPNGVGSKTGNIFGLPTTPETAKVVIIPVPWEVTVSYGAGTAQGPAAVFAAASQLDLFDPDAPEAWKAGIAMQSISTFWQTQNQILRKQAAHYIHQLENNQSIAGDHLASTIATVNQASLNLNTWIKTEATQLLTQGKLVGVLGGDHSRAVGK